MATMQQIEELAAKLAAVRDALTGTYMAKQDELAVIDKKHQPRIRRFSAEFKAAGDALRAAVAESPGLFVKPRSVILHAIKVGFRKGSGKMVWDDDARVVALIKKHFPELGDVLIKTEETPVKGALAELDARQIKALGITVEDTGDVVEVKLADTKDAKMIKALLKSAAAEEAEA